MAKQNLDELIAESEKAIEKGEDLSEVEAEHHHKEKTSVKSQKSKIEEEIKEAKFDKKGDKETEKIETKKEKVSTSQEEEKASTKKETAKKETAKEKKKASRVKAKIRSKKYQQVSAQIDAQKKYALNEAIEMAKKTSFTRFTGNIEVHVRLLSKSKKPEKMRGLIKYPYSTGKKTEIIILDEKSIDDIAKSSKAPADIYIATPLLMPKVARLAKILGPKGKMPNPKAGTVTENPEKTKADLDGGQTEYKTDEHGNLHQVIGKVTQKSEELMENFQSLLAVLPIDKISTISISATMGPGIKVQK